MPEAAVQVNTLGLECPLPIFHARDALFDLDAGGVVEVLTDDPQAPSDFEKWCPRNGHTLRAVRMEGRAFVVVIEKGALPLEGDSPGHAARKRRP